MSIERIGVGPRMSKAVVHGNTVYLAGQVADKTKGGSVAEQTREILGIIDDLSGRPAPTRLSFSTQTSGSGYFDICGNEQRLGRLVSPGNTPRAATVEAKLAGPEYKVEIAVIAAK